MRQALSSSGVSAGYKLPESFKIKLSEPTLAAIFETSEDIQTNKKSFVWNGPKARLVSCTQQTVTKRFETLFLVFTQHSSRVVVRKRNARKSGETTPNGRRNPISGSTLTANQSLA